MNLEGRQFGRLTVLLKADSRNTVGGNVIGQWLCKCICGKEKVVSTSSLHGDKVKSCGCWLIDSAKEKGYKNRKHGGYSKGTSANDKVKYQALVNIQDRSRKRGYESDLEITDLPILTKVCPVLGIEYRKGTLKDKDYSPSIDRKNTNLPYMKKYKTNLVFISHRANRIKSNASVDELKKIIGYIQGHSSE
jgi:hypothetical protein